MGGRNGDAQALFKTPKSWLPPQKITLLDTAVMQSCDAADGVTDGLIQDPRLCTFDPSSLQCPKGESAGAAFADPTCLSVEQIAAVKAIYQGPVTNKGVQLYPGTTKSDPGGSDGNGWAAWITSFAQPALPAPANGEPWGTPPGSFPFASSQWSLQDQFLKYFVFSDPTYNSLRFNINNPNDLEAVEKAVPPAGAGVNPDLTLFLIDSGHKLIVYHGWSDQAPSPLETVNYYQTMVSETFRGDHTLAKNSARLFMVPGMHHCGGGPGPQIGEFDWLVPLDVWVTTGAAPDSIIATNGTRTMPLCAYPETAHYNGGPINEASSWTCR